MAAISRFRGFSLIVFNPGTKESAKPAIKIAAETTTPMVTPTEINQTGVVHTQLITDWPKKIAFVMKEISTSKKLKSENSWKLDASR